MEIRGAVLLERGDHARALRLFREAARLERDVPIELWQRGLADLGMGRALLGLGRNREAIVPLERAMAQDYMHHPPPGRLATIRAYLAVATARAGLDAERARTLANEALADLARLPRIREAEALKLDLMALSK